MRSRFSISLLFGFAACVAGLLAVANRMPELVRRTLAESAPPPFTIVQREILKSAGDAVAATFIEARASDGSRATIHQNSRGPVEKHIRKADGTIVRAYEHVGAKSTYWVPPARALGSQLDPAAGCMQPTEGGILHDTSSSGGELVSGYETVRLTTVTKGTRITAWHARRFGCIPLLRNYEEKQKDGSWKLISVRETTEIAEGEPLEYLFRSEAIEKKPSDVAEMLVRYTFGTQHFPEAEMASRIDAAKQRRAHEDARYAEFGVPGGF